VLVSKPIKVFVGDDDVEIFIPQEMLRDYVLGQESLVFTLSIDDAIQLARLLGERLIY
jgi:hypothetical protein